MAKAINHIGLKGVVQLFALLCFIALAGIQAIAQSPPLKNYTLDDGLASSVVYDTYQDDDGYLWFCTNSGVSRYNGYEFKNYTKKDGLSDNEVFKIFRDTSGRMWFLTFNGKISYYKDGKFFNANNTPWLRKIDSPSFFKGMLEDHLGNLWFCTDRNGIICLTPANKVIRYYSEGDLSSCLYIFESDGGKVLLLTSSGLVSITDNKLLLNTRDFAKPLSLNNVHCKYLDGDSLLIEVFNDFYLFNAKTIELKRLPSFNLKDNKVLNVVETKAKTKWICTMKGAFPFGDPQSLFLKDIMISDVFQDREGNTWFTSLDQGVFMAPSLQISQYGVEDGLPAVSTSCLQQDADKNLWIGQEDGWLSCRREKKFRSYKFFSRQVYAQGAIRSIHPTYKGVWATSDFGIGKIENGSLMMSIMNAGERCVLTQGDSLLIGGPFGLLRTDVTTFTNLIKASRSDSHSVTADSMARFYGQHIKLRRRIHRLFRDENGKVWAGLTDGVLIVTKDSVIDLKKYYPGFSFKISDIEGHSDHSVWISTYDDGVFRFLNGKIKNFSEQNGLLSDHCRSLNIDKSGAVWVATSKGVNKITESGSVQKLDGRTGLFYEDIQDVLVIDDTVFLATKNGLISFNKDLITHPLADETPIYITNFFVLGDDMKYHESSIKVFPYREHSVKINFVGLSYRHNGKLNYRYRFGADDTWHYTTNTSVEYPQLAPGEYQFLVAVQNNDGSWSSKPAVVAFEIEKPFWLQYWFLTLLSLCFVALVWLIFYLRFKSLRRREKMLRSVTEAKLKALRAQMDPHFMFNSLMAINQLVKKNNNESAQKYITGFARLMRQSLENSRDDFIPLSNEIEMLHNYFQLQKLRRLTSFEYQIVVDENIDIENVSIPPMLAQPFIENALEHGIFPEQKQGLIKIQIRHSGDELILEIDDNGIGLKQSAAIKVESQREHKSLATTITRERLSLLNNGNDDIKFDIVELKEEDNVCGTRVIIHIPYMTIF